MRHPIEEIRTAELPSRDLKKNACVYVLLPESDDLVNALVGRSIMIKEIIDVYGEHQYEAAKNINVKAEVTAACEGQY